MTAADGDPGQSRIHTIALTADGHVAGAPIDLGRGHLPSVAADGTNFLVAWRTEMSSDVAIQARTVNGDFTRLGDPRAIASAYSFSEPTVLWREDHYEVLAMRFNSFSGGPLFEILSIDVDREGAAFASRLRELPSTQFAPATNGGDLFMTFVASTPSAQTMFGRLYRGDSAIPDAHELLSWSGNAHGWSALASSAHGHLVAWAEADGTFATRVDAQGHSLDGRGIRLNGAHGRATVGFDGTNYVVAWRDFGFVGVRYVAPATGATVAEVQVPAAYSGPYALAVSTDATYIVFQGARIFVSRIPHATYTPDPVLLAVSPEGVPVEDPAACWNGSALLVTWTEISPFMEIRFPIAIWGARVTKNLSLLDPAPIPIAASDTSWSNYSEASIASDGKDWLVVANRDQMLMIARRVMSDGSVAGNAPTSLGEGESVALTWDGERYVMAWIEDPDENRALFLSAVSASGPITQTLRTRIAPKAGNASLSRSEDAVAVAYSRTSFLPEHGGVSRTYMRLVRLVPRTRRTRH